MKGCRHRGHYAIPLHFELLSVVFVFLDRAASHSRKRNGEERRADGGCVPTEECFRGWTADASLTWSHAASCLQLGIGPVFICSQRLVGDVLAAADDGIRLREGKQLRTQREGCLKVISKSLHFLSTRQQRLCLFELSRGSKTSDGSCDQSGFEAGDSGGLTGSEDIADGSLLYIVDPDEAVVQRAAQQRSQLGVGHQMEAAGEQLARLLPRALPVCEAHGLHLLLAQGGERPASGLVFAASGRGAILQTFNQLSRAS